MSEHCQHTTHESCLKAHECAQCLREGKSELAAMPGSAPFTKDELRAIESLAWIVKKSKQNVGLRMLDAADVVLSIIAEKNRPDGLGAAGAQLQAPCREPGIQQLCKLSVVDLQRTFRLGYVPAKALHERLQEISDPLVTFHGREDEMLFFHRDGKWCLTIHTWSPECARQIETWLHETNTEISGSE